MDDILLKSREIIFRETAIQNQTFIIAMQMNPQRGMRWNAKVCMFGWRDSIFILQCIFIFNYFLLIDRIG